MKIADSDLFMNSSRMYLEDDETKESLRVWVGAQSQADNIPRVDRVKISQEAEAASKKYECELDEAGIESMDGEISLKKLIAELLSGMKIEPVRIETNKGSDPEISEQPEQASQTDQRQGWGLQYDYEQTRHEKENVSFVAKGTIKTADGKEIGFELKLDMNREYIEKNRINIRAGDAAIDPLIINFDGNAAELSEVKFSFDLDADGRAEEISVPRAGRGFLAIDLNNDGVIGSGKELFGPSTGDGFAELSAYDGDGNDWIDENDDIYERLRVMSVDGDGSHTLQTLKDTGVGAIYLGRESTRFDVRAESGNDLLGRVQSTGIYICENGVPGTIQQLDLVA